MESVVKTNNTHVIQQAKQQRTTGIKTIGFGALLFLGGAGVVAFSVLQIRGGADLGPYLLAAGASGFGVGGGVMVTYGGVQVHYARKVINGESEPEEKSTLNTPRSQYEPTNEQLLKWEENWIEEWFKCQQDPI